MSKGAQPSRAATDPDVDLAVPAQRPVVARGLGPVVAVVALGGAIGACARYGASLLWTTRPGSFPWTTLLVNGVGCAVIGVFMVVITDVWAAHRLVRPFFGTGVLGGFTTFSTYAVDIQKFVAAGQPRTGLAYLALTPLVALTAVWSAVWLTRRALVWRHR
ncbi:fluoride efflux transporter CrcB [Streptomyces violascens]|uniref:Fluoride-specific ion channel FluC n=1 Tax=Streptomyces violascens TaxID=67381 RepID=A0ABQ3QFJ9_9ACTN|nr:fluoride efflux transporter CrcB [Streptomyces violascens]GGT87198.1 putative fluoride ion transporter CrcB 1 [Streptomyces violascens]GHI36053.1 putative fluoride ion transporter CrcB 1 [Streptomyces violascens]